MKIFEYIQSATDGGHPVPNGDGVEHGTALLAFEKRELISLMYKLRGYVENVAMSGDNDMEVLAQVDQILKQDHFVHRGDDLPPQPLYPIVSAATGRGKRVRPPNG